MNTNDLIHQNSITDGRLLIGTDFLLLSDTMHIINPFPVLNPKELYAYSMYEHIDLSLCYCTKIFKVKAHNFSYCLHNDKRIVNFLRYYLKKTITIKKKKKLVR